MKRVIDWLNKDKRNKRLALLCVVIVLAVCGFAAYIISFIAHLHPEGLPIDKGSLVVNADPVMASIKHPDYHVYRFQAEAGQELEIRVKARVNREVNFSLRHDNWQETILQEYGDWIIVSWTAPRSDIYEIVIGSRPRNDYSVQIVSK